MTHYRHRSFVAIVPRRFGHPDHVGPFPSLTAALKWGKEHGAYDYITVLTPEQWQQYHSEEVILNNPPLVDVLHDQASIDKYMAQYEAEYVARLDKEHRCRECEVSLGNEPQLIAWGFCSSTCERDYNDARREGA